MNNELILIINELEDKLKLLNDDKQVNNELLNHVKNLQKQLLSASLINKPNLEAKIKEELKVAESQMYAQNNTNKNIEIAYIYQYIKEHYE